MTFDIQGQAGQTTLESKRSGQLKWRLKYPDFVTLCTDHTGSKIVWLSIHGNIELKGQGSQYDGNNKSGEKERLMLPEI